MTITRVGTNAKYAEGWDAAFQGKSAAKSAAKKPAAKKKASPKKAGKRK